MIASFVDTPQHLSVGPVSGLGACTIALAATSVIGLFACGSYPVTVILRSLPYLGFLAWLAVSFIWAPPPFWGIQNGLLYLLYGALVVIAGVVAARMPGAIERLISRWMLWIDFVGLAIIALNVVAAGLPTRTGMWWVGPRSIALLGLIPLAWHLAEWYYGGRLALLPAALWVVAIALSLSRTAMAISLVLLGVILLLQLRFRMRSATTSFLLLAASLTVVVGLITSRTPFRDRFFAGDASIAVGGVRINAEGRLEIWDVVIASAIESPIVGKGVGSSQEVIAASFPGSPGIDHPHNDYLRLWHDLGIIGVSLFVTASVTWLLSLCADWHRAERDNAGPARLQLAGFLGLLGMLLAMLTDNVIIFVFAMGPLGVLVGAGLGVIGRTGDTASGGSR